MDEIWDLFSEERARYYMKLEGIEEGREEGREEGIKEGIKEGIAQTRRKTVLAMIQEGIDAEVIARCCKLSVEDVLMIQKEGGYRYGTEAQGKR